MTPLTYPSCKETSTHQFNEKDRPEFSIEGLIVTVGDFFQSGLCFGSKHFVANEFCEMAYVYSKTSDMASGNSYPNATLYQRMAELHKEVAAVVTTGQKVPFYVMQLFSWITQYCSLL